MACMIYQMKVSGEISPALLIGRLKPARQAIVHAVGLGPLELYKRLFEQNCGI